MSARTAQPPEQIRQVHADTAGVLATPAHVIQNRVYAEAEQLQRQVIEIYRGLAMAPARQWSTPICSWRKI
jgi:hypothetical protein